ncbi:efflux RND transporter permease subunit, partial [Escherichia coli]|uniref:efflux RND transporter permease subunit n=1 Tax=Escherichia coli TaxID=562 RepID=UPI00159B96E9
AESSRTAAAYGRAVASIGRHPWRAAGAIALVLAMGGVLAPKVGRGFLPSMDEGAFVLDYFLPAGTGPKTTEE